MSGKFDFDTQDGGFFPKLHRAACEGARGVIDQTATHSDRTLLEVGVQGYTNRSSLQACTGIGDPPDDPPPSPPWSSLRTHAELNAWAEEQDLATIPEEWFALTVDAKKQWLEDNVSW